MMKKPQNPPPKQHRRAGFCHLQTALLAACMLFLVPYQAFASPTIVTTTIYNIAPTLEFVSSSPANHETLHAAPDSISITLSQKPQAHNSFIKLFNNFGAPVGDGAVTIDGDTMAISPSHLAAGRYKVVWQAACECQGHPVASGTYHFMVQ